MNNCMIRECAFYATDDCFHGDPTQVGSSVADHSYLPDHPQVMINENLHVDKGIAPLLQLLWTLGIKTEYSCQGDDKYFAYILFNNNFYARCFYLMLDKVFNYTELGGSYSMSPRSKQFGGGSAVRFDKQLIPQIEFYFNNMWESIVEEEQ